MKKYLANPTRLSGLREIDDPLGVGRMFRQARELPDEDLPRLRWHLRTSQRMRAIRPRLFLKVALVVGVVFCMGGIVGAVVSPFWARKHSTVDGSRSATTPSKRKTSRHEPSAPEAIAQSAPVLDEQAPVAAETLPDEATVVDPMPISGEDRPALDPLGALSDPPERVPDQPRRILDQARPVSAEVKTSLSPARHHGARLAVLNQSAPAPARVSVSLPAAVPPSPIAAEQALLSQAIRSLRDSRDARTALALLAQHAEQFPNGVLSSEATMVRIEALLALGRRDEALSLLDRVALASLPNRDEQFVVRGELRTGAARWREAQQDFDEMLRRQDLPAANVRNRALQERALWGRASARSRLGDQDGARTDLKLYLRHFPDGRFAGPASTLVKGSP